MKMYRTYPFVGQDPVVTDLKNVLVDMGLISQLEIVATISGVSVMTLHSWLSGRTRKPQHATLAAVFTSLGYELGPVHVRDIDIDEELEKARHWSTMYNSELDRVVNRNQKPNRKI
jgi:hypothetical protein